MASKSFAHINKQIQALMRQAEAVKDEAIARVRKDIVAHGLTVEDLFGKRRVAPKASSAVAAKYADGSGNSWAGMGKRPQWLRAALEAGATLESFLVGRKPAETATVAKKPKKTTKAQAPATKLKAPSTFPAKKASAQKKVATNKAPLPKQARGKKVGAENVAPTKKAPARRGVSKKAVAKTTE